MLMKQSMYLNGSRVGVQHENKMAIFLATRNNLLNTYVRITCFGTPH